MLLLTLITGCSDSGNASHVGYVEAEWVYVAAPQSGWVLSRPADEGSKVAEGDVLFTLDSEKQEAASTAAANRVEQAVAEAKDIAKGAREPEIRALQAELVQAEAALTLARKERDRVLSLADEGIESRQNADQARASYKTALARVDAAREQIRIARQAGRPDRRVAAQANVEAARAARNSAEYDLAQRTIKAKVAGEVSETFLEPGEYAPSGSPVLALLPRDGLKVRFYVSEKELPAYKLGDEVSVSADGLSRPVKGKVSFIGTNAEYTPPVIYSQEARDKLVFLVEARIPADTGLRPGLPVDVMHR